MMNLNSSKLFIIYVAFLFTYLFTVYGTVEVNIKRVTNEVQIPPADDVVCMARYIVHNSDWCSLSYISQKDKSTLDTPLSRIFSISDGVPENSTGTVYFMVSPLDLTVQDLMIQNNCSLIMTLAQSHYCTVQKYDAQDPRCGQVILSGNFVRILDRTEEYDIAKKVLWARHPVMKFWFHFVPTHKWFFAKMEIEHIAIVDQFGGRRFPSVSDYYEKSCNINSKNNQLDLNSITLIKN